MGIRVLLVDDHSILREVVRSLLEKEADMEVVGEAEDGLKALDLVRKFIPDIVITNITMPKLNGIDSTKQIVQEFPNIKVIAWTTHSHKDYVIGMLNAGASGYVLKEDFDELVEAIRDVMAGGKYLSPGLSGEILRKRETGIAPTRKSTLDNLTDSARKILKVLEGDKYLSKYLSKKIKVGDETLSIFDIAPTKRWLFPILYEIQSGNLRTREECERLNEFLIKHKSDL